MIMEYACSIGKRDSEEGRLLIGGDCPLIYGIVIREGIIVKGQIIPQRNVARVLRTRREVKMNISVLFDEKGGE
jgi:hypothetical protein